MVDVSLYIKGKSYLQLECVQLKINTEAVVHIIKPSVAWKGGIRTDFLNVVVKFLWLNILLIKM